MTNGRSGVAITASSRGSVACIVAFLATAGCDGLVGKLDANATAERSPKVSSSAQMRSEGLVPQVDQTCTLSNGFFEAFLVMDQRETFYNSTDPKLNVTTTYQELTQIRCRVGVGDCSVVLFRAGRHPGNIGTDDVLIMSGYQATMDEAKVVVAGRAPVRYTFDLGSRAVTFTLLDPSWDRRGRGSCAGSVAFIAPTK